MATSAVSLVTTVALLVMATPIDEEYRCNYTRRAVCTAEGCKDIQPDAGFLLIPELSRLTVNADNRLPDEPLATIRRCDTQGCSAIEVQGHLSGAFLNVSAGRNGYLLKLSLTDSELIETKRGEFVEVATTMLATFVSYGQCALPPRG